MLLFSITIAAAARRSSFPAASPSKPCATPWWAQLGVTGLHCGHCLATCRTLLLSKLAVVVSFLSVIRNDLTFYFGISENPQRRWAEHSESCGNWQEMIVLVEADSSVRTAGLERTFIKEFGERLACLNIGPGGERASSSSPHYFYMLVGINGLLRRRGRG